MIFHAFCQLNKWQIPWRQYHNKHINAYHIPTILFGIPDKAGCPPVFTTLEVSDGLLLLEILFISKLSSICYLFYVFIIFSSPEIKSYFLYLFFTIQHIDFLFIYYIFYSIYSKKLQTKKQTL